MPCTTILVGKKASYDGSTLMARNEDSPSGQFTAKKFIVVTPEKQPHHYKAVLTKLELDLPDNPMRYTAMPNAIADEGVWGEAGINAENVAMSETETITSNARVLGADPLVKNGISEEDMLTIVLPYIHSAREGVMRLGKLLEEYGTNEMNGIGFQDKDEIWWFESVGGHHWIAKRVPDNSYVVMPNQLGIDSFNFEAALSDGKNYLCSADMKDFIINNHLDLMQESDFKHFDTRAAFGSHDDSDHTYNTPRAWFMGRYFNPTTYKWEGKKADFTPEADNIPWSFVPEKKITVEDIKYVLSSYYQGTDFNPYSKHSDPLKKNKYRPIGINRNNFVAITQLRPYVPSEIAAVEWLAEASNAFNQTAVFYANVRKTPAYLANTKKQPTTENFYWANRIIGALADAHFNECAIHIERYQNKMAAENHRFLKAADESYISQKPEDVNAFLEQQNQKNADFAKKETYALLDKVLYTASCGMKNSFARSDA